MAPQTRVLAGVTVPDTPLITKALAFAQKHLDDLAYNHVVRSWLTGQVIISRLPQPAQDAIDLEAYAIANIFHDLGWSKSPELISKDKCFEVDGANASREWLLREGNPSEWDKHRIQLVWDTIGLHTNPQIAAHKEPEVALSSAGIFTELMGIGPSKAYLGDVVSVKQEEFDAIAKEFPRAGLRDYLKEVMCGFCREKPETTYMNFQAEFGERFVEGYSTEGRKVVDLMMAHLTP